MAISSVDVVNTNKEVQEETQPVPESSAIYNRKIVLGIAPIRSKEDAALLYSEIKKGNVDIKNLSKETQITLKKYLDDNGGILEISKDNQIDWSQYGIDLMAANKKIDQDKHLLEQNKQLEEQKQISLTQEKNTFNYQTTHHIDTSVLIGIGMVCITVLIVVYMFLRRKNRP